MKTKPMVLKKISCILVCTLLWGCGGEEEKEVDVVLSPQEEVYTQPPVLDISRPTIYTQLQEEPQFSSFVSMIKKAKLEYWLNTEESLTIFVPTNDAITPLLQNRAFMNQMIRDKSFVTHFVKGHIITKELSPEVLSQTGTIYNANEEFISVLSQGGKSFLNGIVEINPDTMRAGNGYIYTVESPIVSADNKE